MVVPRFALALYTKCLEINLLNTISQHGNAIISISQLGNWDMDTINNLPKVTQAVHKGEKKK